MKANGVPGGPGHGDPPNTAWRTAREALGLTRPEGDQP